VFDLSKKLLFSFMFLGVERRCLRSSVIVGKECCECYRDYIEVLSSLLLEKELNWDLGERFDRCFVT